MFYSEEYLNLLKIEHARSKKGWGSTGQRYHEIVKSKCLDLNTKEVLDYGCGRATLHEILKPDIIVTNYDPALTEYNQLPQPHDLVICFDVLEHIEIDFLDNVLSHIKSLTKKMLIATVATNPAGRILKDGRNAHLIIEQLPWWNQRFINYFDIVKNEDNLFFLVPKN